MSTLAWILVALALAVFLAFRRAPLLHWTVTAAAVITAAQAVSYGFSPAAWIVLAAVAVVLHLRPLRRQLISRPLMGGFRRLLPPMSDTEKAAIDAGTVWWDAELFTGRPDWRRLLTTPAPRLTDGEQAFLDGPVDELCRMLDDWRINNELNDLPPEAWAFIKSRGFFGMIIPKAYGGLEFSARAQSEVVTRLSTRSTAAAVTVMVPNSLGPGELLLKYGTQAQKDRHLPRLADGREVPAFALTGPYSGSDAGSMPDVGVVCRGVHEGQETLGFRVNWSKRYITLAPVATLLGVAFRARDPEGLLGRGEEPGITCALVPGDAEGVTVGQRHDPGTAFLNGPTEGRDVFVPMDWVIGGVDQVGQGWKMLMDCLAVGRAISLPAQGAAAGMVAARTTGAYARVRRQFRIPIGRFEGVEEALARIGGLAYRMNAGRCMTAGALDQGEKPAVLGAILKHHNTEGMRRVINDALDVHGGRGVCRGPSNYLAGTYAAVPVAITVEGANILTRSMIVFGQGAIRCHPYVLAEMRAAEAGDLAGFDAALFSHLGYTVSNKVRAFVLGLTGGRGAAVPDIGPNTRYLAQITRYCAAFAFAADLAMAGLGGDLKRKEKISGRFADALAHLYLASAVIKQHEDDGRPAEDLPLVRWALEDSLRVVDESLAGICDNFPGRALGRIMRLIVLPRGAGRRPPSDALGAQVARLLLEPGPARDRLTAAMFLDPAGSDPVSRVELALQKVLAAEPVERRLGRALGRVPVPWDYHDVIEQGLAQGVINDMEARVLREAMEMTAEAIAVDVFEGEEMHTVSPRQGTRVAQ